MIYVYLFVLHFVADFLMQSREMGKKKSYEFKWLTRHLSIQYLVFLVGLIPIIFIYLNTGLSWPLALMGAMWYANKFALANALIHGVIDWNIWRLYKLYAYKRIKAEADSFSLSEEEKQKWITESGKNWQYWEDHWFYTTIGFDQFLHMSTLVLVLHWVLL